MKNAIPFILLLLAFTLFSCTCNQDQESSKSEEQLLRIPYKSETDQTDREYFVYLPKGYDDEPTKEWPVLLYLHGNGERGNGKDELDYVLIHGPLYEVWIQKRDLPFVIISPQLHMFGQDTIKKYIAKRTKDQIPIRLEKGVSERPKYFPTSKQMNGVTPSKELPPLFQRFPVGWEMVEQDVLNILDSTHVNFRTDKNSVYLSGLSYGGVGTFYIGSRNTEKFAAINPIVGWGAPEHMEPIAKAQLPIWVFAGGNDTSVKSENFYKGLNILKELGHKDIRFTIHEDTGHVNTWRRVYGGQDIYDWFLQHSNNTK